MEIITQPGIGWEWVAAISGVAFLAGVVAGLFLHYIVEYKPLLEKYHSMRLQGFVPQYSFKIRKQNDPSSHIRER